MGKPTYVHMIEQQDLASEMIERVAMALRKSFCQDESSNEDQYRIEDFYSGAKAAIAAMKEGRAILTASLCDFPSDIVTTANDELTKFISRNGYPGENWSD